MVWEIDMINIIYALSLITSCILSIEVGILMLYGLHKQ
jgi:hypothetical protein